MKTYTLITQHGLYQYGIPLDMAADLTGCDDIEACIEEDGWCGCWIDTEPCVVVEADDFQHGLPDDANGYLSQQGDEEDDREI